MESLTFLLEKTQSLTKVHFRSSSDLFISSASLRSAIFLVEAHSAAVVVGPSNIAILDLTNPLWSSWGPLSLSHCRRIMTARWFISNEGRFVASKIGSLERTMPSHTCAGAAGAPAAAATAADMDVFLSRSLDSFSTTRLIRRSMFCDRGRSGCCCCCCCFCCCCCCCNAAALAASNSCFLALSRPLRPEAFSMTHVASKYSTMSRMSFS